LEGDVAARRHSKPDTDAGKDVPIVPVFQLAPKSGPAAELAAPVAIRAG
jgi:hypothetical protein